eukprot:scaffold4445_cov132-Cylindrotheca_fusiformis.AAC.6
MRCGSPTSKQYGRFLKLAVGRRIGENSPSINWGIFILPSVVPRGHLPMTPKRRAVMVQLEIGNVILPNGRFPTRQYVPGCWSWKPMTRTCVAQTMCQNVCQPCPKFSQTQPTNSEGTLQNCERTTTTTTSSTTQENDHKHNSTYP